MGQIKLEQRVRYPPFEPGRFAPETLPIATTTTEVSADVSPSDVVDFLSEQPPSFKLGTENNWLVEQRYIYDNEIFDDSNIKRKEGHIEERDIPRMVKLHRQGWYLTPNPVHKAVRQFMSFSVVVLLLALAYLFIEPILSSMGIPGVGTGTVRIGLLDYPALAIVVVPLLFAPLILRVAANFVDLVSQRRFLNSAPADPVILTESVPTAGQPLKVSVEFKERPEDWKSIDVMWRVGILSPAREEVFAALGRSTDSQPPPGLTTALPHHWEIGLDDGTGGGEESPMEHHEVKGGLFLRPMRVMEFGGRLPWATKIMELDAPPNQWPGTVSTSLIRIHWEVIIRIEREKGGSLMFVQPLRVAHPTKPAQISALPTNDGRTESNQL
jgi:hypothetical protein